ncbi:hypothetical protein KFK09_026492 [Dendrobium nobile]|uniref:Reverse transcriptase zinc-binding domain-containing protein n=1 Tax=Dendrobium nobile TaxID=94219 RepID=A0A8T3A811_DENNO|nr:hypothetical protein KFK09_026492 [Dendrobium nobile]
MGVLRDLDKLCKNFLWTKQDKSSGIHYVEWKILCKQIKFRGQGVMSTADKVGSWRAKFAWSLISNPASLLNQILIAKYGRKFSFSGIKLGNSPSWKIINNGDKFLQQIVRWKVSDDQCCLKFFLHIGSWNIQILNQTFGKELVDLISSIPIKDGIQGDEMEIIYSNSGKSLAALISDQRSIHEEEDVSWKWLKKLKLRPRVKILWWRLIHKAIPSNEFLMYRRIINHKGCPRGCCDMEDANHLAVHCFFLKDVISVIKKWGYDIPVLTDLENCFNWLSIYSNYNPFFGNLYCSTVFFSWKSRNKLVHGVKEDNLYVIAANLLLFPINWNPPPTEWIKLNVDASLAENYIAGIGGVIRDSKGRFLFAFGFKRTHWDISALEMEALFALNKVLQEWMYDAKRIIIEGDNFNVMKHI